VVIFKHSDTNNVAERKTSAVSIEQKPNIFPLNLSGVNFCSNVSIVIDIIAVDIPIAISQVQAN